MRGVRERERASVERVSVECDGCAQGRAAAVWGSDTGVMEVTVEAVGVVVPLGRGHLGEAEFVLEHLHVLEQRLGGAWWVHMDIHILHIYIHMHISSYICIW